ncbi:E3 ubiquitin-protein ligase At3g02290-like [Cornus florida]|uniref:E3 ubiquitin-protein ligase At3g02290-like n=1 Tax=Cornus florida TaxID=4283 RepID=UPI00289852CB|nr:E3 ubiquitin-protein ligase At3g02290-like [Cornus florida]
MGSVCCCFRVSDVEEIGNSNSINNGNHITPNSFFQSLMNKYGELLGRRETHTVTTSIQEAASSNSTVPSNNTQSDTNRSRGRHLPNNVNAQNSQLQRVGLVPRHGKHTGHSHSEAEPIRRSNVQIKPKTLSGGDKPSGFYNEHESKECHSESSTTKVLSANEEGGFGHAYASSEDEDVCPTCLEEYTPENPKINTQCSHHFHLGCIYEWMERSELCPVCAKLMVFAETT